MRNKHVEKRQLTICSMSLVLDGQRTRGELEQGYIPILRRMLMMQGDKYAPEVAIDKVEFLQMNVVPRKADNLRRGKIGE